MTEGQIVKKGQTIIHAKRHKPKRVQYSQSFPPPSLEKALEHYKELCINHKSNAMRLKDPTRRLDAEWVKGAEYAQLRLTEELMFLEKLIRERSVAMLAKSTALLNASYKIIMKHKDYLDTHDLESIHQISEHLHNNTWIMTE